MHLGAWWHAQVPHPFTRGLSINQDPLSHHYLSFILSTATFMVDCGFLPENDLIFGFGLIRATGQLRQLMAIAIFSLSTDEVGCALLISRWKELPRGCIMAHLQSEFGTWETNSMLIPHRGFPQAGPSNPTTFNIHVSLPFFCCFLFSLYTKSIEPTCFDRFARGPCLVDMMKVTLSP